jgi:hypothetical protein
VVIGFACRAKLGEERSLVKLCPNLLPEAPR